MPLADFDTLECPGCGYLCKPTREYPSGCVSYRCANPEWCNVKSWVIDRDGDIVHERHEGNDKG